MKKSHFLVGIGNTIGVLIAAYIGSMPATTPIYGISMVWWTILLIWSAERGER